MSLARLFTWQEGHVVSISSPQAGENNPGHPVPFEGKE